MVDTHHSNEQWDGFLQLLDKEVYESEWPGTRVNVSANGEVVEVIHPSNPTRRWRWDAEMRAWVETD